MRAVADDSGNDARVASFSVQVTRFMLKRVT